MKLVRSFFMLLLIFPFSIISTNIEEVPFNAINNQPEENEGEPQFHDAALPVVAVLQLPLMQPTEFMPINAMVLRLTTVVGV